MNSILLYHGSRTGITGDIQPKSRSRCDFGSGFYMGTRPEQAKGLVYNDIAPMFYTMNLHLENIPDMKILTLSDMDWAFYVLYNRGSLETIKNTPLYEKISNLDRNKDIVIGPIADDNMNSIMKKFIKGEITDKAFLECIRCIDYGVQYVAKTETACQQIEILSAEKLDMSKYKEYQKFNTERRKESKQKVDTIRHLYRRDGQYLDQILDIYKTNSQSCILKG